MMPRWTLFIVALIATACPDPEVVGHAPKAQVDVARERIDAAAAANKAKLEAALPTE
jgi:hypothetical protein